MILKLQDGITLLYLEMLYVQMFLMLLTVNYL